MLKNFEELLIYYGVDVNQINMYQNGGEIKILNIEHRFVFLLHFKTYYLKS